MRDEQNQNELYISLIQYGQSGIYPMHMPGHKRALAPVPGLPYEWDVTEVEGTDDLHDAEGILRTAMDRTRDLVGSKRTWYLVGGSTCGNLAAIYAMVPRGGEIIAARNCHKSVYHAIELLELSVHWIYPERIEEFDIPGSIDPANVQEMLERFPGSAAVVITSPTYEGILSDIKEIARVTHAAGKLLFVDEAHGAHLGLFRQEDETRHGENETGEFAEETAENRSLKCDLPEYAFPECDLSERDLLKCDLPKRDFPDSAVHLGADVVVQSAHKTLPSLTQTAYLHLCSDRVSETALEQGLNIFETSSPSYPLLASLDGCTGWLMEHGKESFRRWREQIRSFEEAARGWENLLVLGVKLESASESRMGSEPMGEAALHKTAGDRVTSAPCEIPKGRQEESRQMIAAGCYARDPGKILVCSKKALCSGKELQDFLRTRENIETEMSCGGNVLLMTSCADTEDGWMRTRTALEHLNEELKRPEQCGWIAAVVHEQAPGDQKESAESQAQEQTEKHPGKFSKELSLKRSLKRSGKQTRCQGSSDVRQDATRSEYVQVLPGDLLPGDEELSLTAAAQKALHGQTQKACLEDAAGRICAEYVTPYPPGIPLLVPGERITAEQVRQLRDLHQRGASVQYSMH